jgi:2-oxoglutarate ferredoxin oxidoreductase subunit gamma
MNLPSLDKYEDTVAPGGVIFVDSTLIERKVNRTDVTVYYVPSTQLASDNSLGNLANMIMMGKLMDVNGDYNEEGINAALGKVISARHADMQAVNLKALEIGKNN